MYNTFLETDSMEEEIMQYFLEWAESHADFLNWAAIIVLLTDFILIVAVIIKREWVLNQLREHSTTEKLFIISFFAAAVGGASSVAVVFRLVLPGFHVGLILLTAVLLMLVVLSALVCFVTFILLAVRLFILMKPLPPFTDAEVNWGGTPILVIALAYLAVTFCAALFSESAGLVAGSVVFIALPLFLVLKPYNRSLKAMKFENPLLKPFLYSLPLLLVLFLGNELVYEITEMVIGEFPLDEITEDLILRSPLVMSILVGVVGPVGEEVFFRGFAHSALRRKFGFKKGILLSSLFFGVYHLIPWQIPYAFVAGLILAYVYEKTGSLYTCILFHVINNSAAVIATWM